MGDGGRRIWCLGTSLVSCTVILRPPQSTCHLVGVRGRICPSGGARMATRDWTTSYVILNNDGFMSFGQWVEDSFIWPFPCLSYKNKNNFPKESSRSPWFCLLKCGSAKLCSPSLRNVNVWVMCCREDSTICNIWEVIRYCCWLTIWSYILSLVAYFIYVFRFIFLTGEGQRMRVKEFQRCLSYINKEFMFRCATWSGFVSWGVENE